MTIRDIVAVLGVEETERWLVGKSFIPGAFMGWTTPEVIREARCYDGSWRFGTLLGVIPLWNLVSDNTVIVCDVIDLLSEGV